MLFKLLIQAFVLPAILSVASAYLFFKQLPSFKLTTAHASNAVSGLSVLLMMSWLFVSFWILGMPALIPAQASDWFWLVIITTILLSISHKKLNTSVIITIIFAIAVIAKTWPILTYKATLSSHIHIWLEVLVFIIAGAYLLKQKPDIHLRAFDKSIYGVVVGFAGLTALITGSITIAFLCFSLACIILTTMLYIDNANHFYIDKLLLMISLLLLLHVRQYAEAGLISIVMILGAFALILQQNIRAKLRYSLVGICISILLIDLAFTAYSVISQPYY